MVALRDSGPGILRSAHEGAKPRGVEYKRIAFSTTPRAVI